jgi:hypothetical protein
LIIKLLLQANKTILMVVTGLGRGSGGGIKKQRCCGKQAS